MNSRNGISPDRKAAFLEFVSSLPRQCSPTIGGLLTLTPSKARQLELISSPKLSNSSIWTLDDWSEMYGKDFDNVHEIEEFHQFETESEISKQMEMENRQFFSQPTIIPSPICIRKSESKLSLFENIEQHSFADSSIEDEDGTNFRNTGSFISYIDAISNNNMATSKDDPWSVDVKSFSFEFNSNNNNSMNDSADFKSVISLSELSDEPKRLSHMYSVDSDFVTATPEQMDISFDWDQEDKHLSIVQSRQSNNFSPIGSCSKHSNSIYSSELPIVDCDFDNISPVFMPSKRTSRSSLMMFEMNKENMTPEELNRSKSDEQQLQMSMDISPISSARPQLTQKKSCNKKLTRNLGRFGGDGQFKTPIGRARRFKGPRPGKQLFNEACSTPEPKSNLNR